METRDTSDSEDAEPQGTERYNESLTPNLLDGYSDPDPYEDLAWSLWTRSSRCLPSRWPINNPIEHVRPYLEANHVPHEHGSNICLNADNLHRNHEIMFYRAAYYYHLRHPEDMEPECYSELYGSKGFWASATFNDTPSIAYYEDCNERLRRLGYCILEGFLDDARMPENFSDITFPRVDDGLFYKRLREDAMQCLPGV